MPLSRSDVTAVRTSSRLSASLRRKTWPTEMRRPEDSSTSPTAVWLRASRDSTAPRPMPRTPTAATSPSSRALVACVVLWAMKTTSPGLTAAPASTRRNASITPAATPSRAVCDVGTTACPTIAWVSSSTITAFVKVPPTSMPIRTNPIELPGERASEHRVGDDRVDGHHRPAEGQRRFQEVAVGDLRIADGPQRPRVGRILAALQAERAPPEQVEEHRRNVGGVEHDGQQDGAGADDAERPAIDGEWRQQGEEDRGLERRVRDDRREDGIQDRLHLLELTGDDEHPADDPERGDRRDVGEGVVERLVEEIDGAPHARRARGGS